MSYNASNLSKRVIAFVMFFVLLSLYFLPVSAVSQNKSKTVRVGWYESPFNSTDKSGRRSGYAYEYQFKIAAYAGWEYSYVSGSWSDLLVMLKNGEIDLLSDVSYTEERSSQMLFPDLPMGTEEYCIFISPDNNEITSEDYSTLSGKRIGVNKGSIQIDFYNEWAKKHGVSAELVELTTTEVEALDMLDRGSFDAYITLKSYGDPERLAPVCKIGSSDFFFVVNKERTDLLRDLNEAMSRIQDENPYYNQVMFEKYLQRNGSNAFLTNEESAWLESHGAIRIGYQNNYLAFCAEDPETGELTGALNDYLSSAENCLNNVNLEFTAKSYPTAAEMLSALKRGEIDCAFPVNLGCYDSETMSIMITHHFASTDMYAVVRQTDQTVFSSQKHVIVAVNEGNTNYDAFLEDNYPDWHIVRFSTTYECLEAVSKGIADCVLISNFRYNNISRDCERLRLTTFSTGRQLNYCFAVSEGETELYAILSKVVGIIPNSTINSALSYYITQDAKITFSDFIRDNLGIVIAVLSAVVILILLLLIRSLYSEKKAKKLISATETDALTGLYTRNYFFEYANRIFKEHPDVPHDAIVINIEQFHSINAYNGWEFGDRILRILGNEIAEVVKENGGIAGRFGADRFDIYCRHIDNVQSIFERLQKKLINIAPNTSIRLRMGVMRWMEKLEPLQMFDRARTACSMARGHYFEHLIIYDEKMHEREILNQRLLNDLRKGIDNYEFEVFYQPKFDISGSEPKLLSAEALIRWRHHELGMITPDSFVPLFERNGKIGELDKYVWSQTARQIARWRAKFGIKIPVSVNLSRVDIFEPELGNILDSILEENGLDHSAILLEVTESVYTENADQVVSVIESLRQRGFTIELDDFGTGYSSLHMLSSMPIDVLKMDRSFIFDIENNKKNVQLVALIIGIAKNMNIPVIAEGVETEQQVKILKDLGCSFVQGYYFSKPLHPTDFMTNILQNKKYVETSENHSLSDNEENQ